MSETCFICRETGSKMCSGLCGLCADQEEGPEIVPEWEMEEGADDAR